MSGLDHQWATRVLSGEDRGISAMSLRTLTAIAEPFYSLAMIGRNFAYDRGFFNIRSLPRPTISVGNLTTGGTGKTPMVRWLCEQFIARGFRPAILLRGYHSEETSGSDEARLLADALENQAVVVANRDRVAGSQLAMTANPPPDVFVLDDAFQHRRVARDFNLVLIDATQPFGYGHVLPRGLMREPRHGLRRTDAAVITRSDQISVKELEALQDVLRHLCGTAPIYIARHANTGLLSSSSGSTVPIELPISELSRQRFFAFAGIANPQSLRQQLNSSSGNFVGFRAFSDHHAFTAGDLIDLQCDAKAVGATMLLTTEKDWVKIRTLAHGTTDLPIFRLNLRIEFQAEHEERLLRQVMDCFERRRSAATVPAPQARS